MNYLTSTFAPASSSFFLAASVSALFAPSSTGFGAPSTSALASANPRPALISRTALIAAIFLSAGAETRITSNVSFAAAAGAAPPAAAPPPAATATGAAALTPHLVSSCFTKSAASKNRQLAQFFHDVCNVSHITFLSVVSSSAEATANFSSQPANRRFTFVVCFFRFEISNLKSKIVFLLRFRFNDSTLQPITPFPPSP